MGMHSGKTGERQNKRRLKRLGWFLLIWCLSVAAIATVGYGLRAFVNSIYGI